MGRYGFYRAMVAVLVLALVFWVFAGGIIPASDMSVQFREFARTLGMEHVVWPYDRWR